MKPRPIIGQRGKEQFVEYLEYVCVNQKTGCRYKVKSTSMTNMEMVEMRADGSEIKIEGQYQ
jgi:hypothetical protein